MKIFDFFRNKKVSEPGYSECEIKKVENKLGFLLSEDIKEFLKNYGRRSLGVFGDELIFYMSKGSEDFIDYQEFLKAALTEEGFQDELEENLLLVAIEYETLFAYACVPAEGDACVKYLNSNGTDSKVEIVGSFDEYLDYLSLKESKRIEDRGELEVYGDILFGK